MAASGTGELTPAAPEFDFIYGLFVGMPVSNTLSSAAWVSRRWNDDRNTIPSSGRLRRCASSKDLDYLHLHKYSST
jgi:hypothetical protein